MDKPLILVVNLGATSSKLALFEAEQSIAQASIPLDDDTAALPLAGQHETRLGHLKGFLAEHKAKPAQLSAIASRGGLMKPLARRGVYSVDRQMVDDLAGEKYGSHPSNLSAVISFQLAQEAENLPVYVVDPVSIDTLWDVARVSGVPEIQRLGRHHALNVQRAAKHAARELGRPLHTLKLVVAHFGSGVSICTMQGSRVVDVNDAQLGEGPFSVARAGSLPIHGVMDLLAGADDPKQLRQYLARRAGMAAYTGTSDFREIELKLEGGDAGAHAPYNAMVFQSAKYIAAYAGSLGERPDAVVLTGGLVKSRRFADDITSRVSWIAPVLTMAGEDEMSALAEGVLGALDGTEPVHDYATAATSADAPPLDLDEVISRSTRAAPCRFVVAGGNQQEIAETVAWCREHGIRGFVLVGPADETSQLLKAQGVDLGQVEIVEAEDVVARALELVQAQPNSALVKGKCNTAALLKGVLDCLPHDHRPFLSHVAVVENPRGERLVGISDGGLNLDPDLPKKIGMLENAVAMFQALGVRQPNVLLAAGMEDKGQDIPAIADAREIVRRHREGEWPQCVIDGPFGIDIGLLPEAAALKGITTPVSGRADIIITPNLESCNFSVKMAIAYTGRPWAGLVVGGPFPVVLGSRADDAQSRVASIALAQLVAAGT